MMAFSRSNMIYSQLKMFRFPLFTVHFFRSARARSETSVFASVGLVGLR